MVKRVENSKLDKLNLPETTVCSSILTGNGHYDASGKPDPPLASVLVE